jgi:pimeloyl-ACP methyl ester carboxylesterase
MALSSIGPLSQRSSTPTHYQSVSVEGLNIFYREAGRRDAPSILLLHGFPTSSHMFRDLIPLLSDEYHVIAPDYPGFGYSSAPSVGDFEYTFDSLAEVVERFIDVVGLQRFALYLQDFGGPVGLRVAARRPEKVSALIIQNANAYVEGVSSDLYETLVRVHKERTVEMRARLGELFELPYTRKQFLDGVEDPSLVSPDAWQHAQWGMDRPGNKDIQYELHADYAANFERYREWQAYFRNSQPPSLVVWGKHDFVFGVAGAEAYRRDLKAIEVHILNAGHFALETHSLAIAQLMQEFLQKYVGDAPER